MRFSLILIAFAVLCFACEQAPPAEKQQEKPRVVENEDDLLTELSMQLIANPRSQAQLDQNKIINHAIGELLEVQSTKSGLYYYIIDPGAEDDIPPRSGDIIHVVYKGYFLDGTIFDQSAAGQPLKIRLVQVIPGWQEALPMLKKGGKGIFLIPSYLGYGKKGFGKNIPPNEVLKFEIEIVDIDRY